MGTVLLVMVIVVVVVVVLMAAGWEEEGREATQDVAEEDKDGAQADRVGKAPGRGDDKHQGKGHDYVEDASPVDQEVQLVHRDAVVVACGRWHGPVRDPRHALREHQDRE